MVLQFVLFCLVFYIIVWYFIFIYSALTHSDKQQHHFHCYWYRHRWVYHVVLQKYISKVFVNLFDFYSPLFKVFIYLPYINTQQRTTVSLNSTNFLSSSDFQTPRLYQVSAYHCEGYCNLDVIFLLRPVLTTHYCNQ